ncbi:MAG: prephenate dehydrogenase [Clostridiales bacterium]|nr:prephenate dehydrogenase [Clostridiales bacterium]
MKIGIIGLGLIGGSMAKAITEHTDHTVLGADLDSSVVLKAKMTKVIEQELLEEDLPSCDMLILALYPKATVEYISAHAGKIKKGALVIDCCGVKEVVCTPVRSIAAEHGFTFIGGHPMAGTEHSGFEYSLASLFAGASMILTPYPDHDLACVEFAKEFFLKIGFGSVIITTPLIHDKRIAFTSQLAHVVSNAYVKSPTAINFKGFSAGSFRDLTRVAYLNETMWTELFLENRENLAEEIDCIADRLREYSAALKAEDAETLKQLLKEGRELKEKVDRL